jgi:hypothetical protein
VSVGATPIASRIVIRGPVADARFLIRCDSPPVGKTTRIHGYKKCLSDSPSQASGRRLSACGGVLLCGVRTCRTRDGGSKELRPAFRRHANSPVSHGPCNSKGTIWRR